METSKIVESILETVRAEMTEFIEQESSITCPIEYETKIIRIANTMAKNLLIGAQGKLPKSRNAKKKSKPHLES
jgi:hypothetical protein